MAKEVAISKRLKISQAEEYMIAAVFGASAILGVAISLVLRFTKQISFNTSVIMAEEQTIVSYSDVIKNTGVCQKPKGAIYTDDELKRCNPSSITASQVPGTLRANVIDNLSANKNLNSVTKINDTACLNRDTDKEYTLKELDEKYYNATTDEERQLASNLIKSCSALRVIPDALPAYENQEALLASLNKIFLDSGWLPQTLRPDDSDTFPILSQSLNAIPVSLIVESDSGTTMRVLHNIERSIREFDIYRASIEWGSDDTLIVQGRAVAYYVDPSAIKESTVTVSGKNNKVTNSATGEKK